MMFSYERFAKLKIESEVAKKTFKTDDESIIKFYQYLQSLRKRKIRFKIYFIKKRKQKLVFKNQLQI